MDKQFPPEFQQLMQAPNVRKAVVSDLKSPNPNDCPNCAGMGSMVIYIATRGPFNSPASGKDVVTKYADGKWWGGKHYEFPCPVCRSLTKPYQGTASAWERNEQKASQAIKELTDSWAVPRDEEER